MALVTRIPIHHSKSTLWSVRREELECLIAIAFIHLFAHRSCLWSTKGMFSEYACNHQQSALHERRTSCDRAEIVYELVHRWWVNLTRTPLGDAPHELLFYMIFWHRLKEEPNNGMRYGTILFLPDWPSTGINLSYVSKFSFPYLILSHDRDSPISPFLWSHILVERTKKEGLG